MPRTDRAERVVHGPLDRMFAALVDRAALETWLAPDSMTCDVDVLPNERVVQTVEFVSNDPAFAGTMTMTWTLRALDSGTSVAITAEDVPDAISADEHAAGLAASLDNLARYVESASSPASGGPGS